MYSSLFLCKQRQGARLPSLSSPGPSVSRSYSLLLLCGMARRSDAPHRAVFANLTGGCYINLNYCALITSKWMLSISLRCSFTSCLQFVLAVIRSRWLCVAILSLATIYAAAFVVMVMVKRSYTIVQTYIVFVCFLLWYIQHMLTWQITLS